MKDHTWAHNEYAKFLMEGNNRSPELALQHIKIVTAKEPNVPAYMLLARACHDLEENEQTIAALEECIDKMSGNQQLSAQLMMANSYARLGQIERADHWYEAFAQQVSASPQSVPEWIKRMQTYTEELIAQTKQKSPLNAPNAEEESKPVESPEIQTVFKRG